MTKINPGWTAEADFRSGYGQSSDDRTLTLHFYSDGDGTNKYQVAYLNMTLNEPDPQLTPVALHYTVTNFDEFMKSMINAGHAMNLRPTEKPIEAAPESPLLKALDIITRLTQENAALQRQLRAPANTAEMGDLTRKVFYTKHRQSGGGIHDMLHMHVYGERRKLDELKAAFDLINRGENDDPYVV